MTDMKISDFTLFVKNHTCLDHKYVNFDIMTKDVIDCVDYYVENEITKEERENIKKDSKQLYEVLFETDFFDNILKTVTGFDDLIFDLNYEKGLFYVHNYYFDIQGDLCQLILKHYF